MSLRKFILEENSHDLIETIIKDKSKNLNVWFKTGRPRFVDPFIIGACRAIFFDLPRRDITDLQRKKGFEVMDILELSDRENILLSMRIIAYYDKMCNARTEEEKGKTHEVIFNLTECLTITEEYFKASWVEANPKNNFKVVLQDDNPDNILMKDFDELFFPDVE